MEIKVGDILYHVELNSYFKVMEENRRNFTLYRYDNNIEYMLPPCFIKEDMVKPDYIQTPLAKLVILGES